MANEMRDYLEQRERELEATIEHLRKVITFAFDALESNNEAEAYLILKHGREAFLPPQKGTPIERGQK